METVRESGHALVVGAGIGGLAAALALGRTGWRVTVLEQAAAIGEIGAGIQLSPNGVRVLSALGVLDGLLPTAFHPEAVEMRLGRSGRHVFRIELAETAVRRWGAPYLHVHRADLLDALLTGTAGSGLDITVRTGSTVRSYEQTPEGVTVSLDSGRRVSGSLLVGADGIHSVIRGQMLGADEPRFTGHVAWRVTVPVERLGRAVPPPTACLWVGDGRHAITYRLRGGALVNLVAVVERDEWRGESWTERGTRQEALADFEGWHPTVTTTLREADTHYRWALFDREPLENWADGRVALLGDACHPMLPYLAQGATMAIEDARVLAHRLQHTDDVPRALRSYAAARRPRTARVQAGARRNGQRFHQGDDFAYLPLWLLGKLAPRLYHRRLDWLYGYRAP
ncbi:FAD-dependent monooxygenase [Streptomyces lomondensis]|uniref:Monooxygenase n=1 Tax=Streptomyces lomondensis TaxID=68229 RepID=A0ABQ2X3A6_9ACTN|nr:FAD-dependent monooxygenase [Streptomyces lomondensis]MCF0080039.1 FAD-dependent monooxygenase [Streptomyces lomondensis]GGW96553.1 monooxygenase [Streptomyces lomondensis]